MTTTDSSSKIVYNVIYFIFNCKGFYCQRTNLHYSQFLFYLQLMRLLYMILSFNICDFMRGEESLSFSILSVCHGMQTVNTTARGEVSTVFH